MNKNLRDWLIVIVVTCFFGFGLWATFTGYGEPVDDEYCSESWEC